MKLKNTTETKQKILTVADTERAQWYCLCLLGGWRRQKETSEWAMSSAGETAEGSWQTAQGETHNKDRFKMCLHKFMTQTSSATHMTDSYLIIHITVSQPLVISTLIVENRVKVEKHTHA